jgi:hypothetical protein
MDPGRGTESLIVNYVAISSAFIAATRQFVPELQERLKKSGNGLMRPTRRAQCSQDADRTIGSTGRASSKMSVCGLLVDWSIELVVALEPSNPTVLMAVESLRLESRMTRQDLLA